MCDLVTRLGQDLLEHYLIWQAEIERGKGKRSERLTATPTCIDIEEVVLQKRYECAEVKAFNAGYTSFLELTQGLTPSPPLDILMATTPS